MAILTLPIGVLMAFIVMRFQGLSANIMSLGGIAIGLRSHPSIDSIQEKAMSRFHPSRSIPVLSVFLVTLLGLSACTRGGSASSSVADAIPAASTSLVHMVVHKSPQCGCCSLWVEHMQAAGYTVDVRESNDLVAIKRALGVPADSASCHTAEIGGYFIEGHVPVADVQRLLAEKPAARGLTVPGMPLGAPGMPVAPGQEQPYQVLQVAADGSTSVYAQHDQ